ncbi:hypothetical protein [Methanobrevibacter sp.]|uniref:hypothetical protein n=1 Tax=Methanobrevibacter sp. TaxID=66852 RepID=UPI0038703FFB
MKEIKVDPNWHFPKTRRTDFTNEEMLDIIDFYLQYKPMLEEYVSNRNHYPQFEPHDFTLLLYMYEMLDVNYIENMKRIKKKYGKQNIDELSKEKFDFLEAITLFTWIHRASRGDIEDETYTYCIENDVYYDLLCRLEEIKYELKNIEFKDHN